MNVLSTDVWHVQNPALGALLLWRFAVGYQRSRSDAAPCPIPLVFLVLPILLHQDSAELVQSTQQSSGLRAFVAKFGEARRGVSDYLLAIHDRTDTMKSLSVESLRIAFVARLMSLDRRAATLMPLTTTLPRLGIPDSVRPLIRDAEKLGTWCSQLTLHEISSALKVRF
jgi:hypothetical protein